MIRTTVALVLSVVVLWLGTEVRVSQGQDWNDGTPVTPYVGQDDSLAGAYNYSQYQPYPKIERELKRLSKQNHNSLTTKLFIIGKTFKKRKIWALKLHQVDDVTQKRIILLDCGAHAREWIAPSTCMYLINELVHSKSSMRRVLNKYDWVIIPSLNPDGYSYTWKKGDRENKRLWRKNRSYTNIQLKKFKETGNPLCIGVDINRNFDKVWGGPGAPKNDPCYEMYAGNDPFSEKESIALADYIRSIEKNLVAYVSLHCYGQSWMTPWGFTTKRPGQYKEMKRVAKLAVKKMKEYSGVTYDVGPSHDELYPNSGSSTDWVYDNFPTPYTYLIEMIPKETTEASFMMPPEAMVKNAKDIVVGLVTMTKNIKEGKTTKS